MPEQQWKRRIFLIAAIAGGISGLGSLSAPAAYPDEKKPETNREPESDISPTKDLLQEHGVSNRLLFIYDFAMAKLQSEKPFPRKIIFDAAASIRSFARSCRRKN